LGEEYRLKVFGKRIVTNTFGPKREGVAEEWRKLHNRELHDLNSSSIIFISNQEE
jgi:hypothetical protein